MIKEVQTKKEINMLLAFRKDAIRKLTKELQQLKLDVKILNKRLTKL